MYPCPTAPTTPNTKPPANQPLSTAYLPNPLHPNCTQLTPPTGNPQQKNKTLTLPSVINIPPIHPAPPPRRHPHPSASRKVMISQRHAHVTSSPTPCTPDSASPGRPRSESTDRASWTALHGSSRVRAEAEARMGLGRGEGRGRVGGVLMSLVAAEVGE
jgi:hypothetical protein